MSRHDSPWTLRPPLRLDGKEGQEATRPCDLVVCPRCLAVRYIGLAQLEERTPPGFGAKKVRGVFCPGCDQLLFDQNSWADHLADRKIFDRAKEAERAKRLGPPSVGTVQAGEAEAADSELTVTDDTQDEMPADDNEPGSTSRASTREELVGA